jgi:hypothetical protein
VSSPQGASSSVMPGSECVLASPPTSLISIASLPFRKCGAQRLDQIRPLKKKVEESHPFLIFLGGSYWVGHLLFLSSLHARVRTSLSATRATDRSPTCNRILTFLCVGNVSNIKRYPPTSIVLFFFLTRFPRPLLIRVVRSQEVNSNMVFFCRRGDQRGPEPTVLID